MSEISVPHLPYDRLREIAAQFLEQHYPSREIPIPIEEILEFKFGINIIPMPGLQEALELED